MKSKNSFVVWSKELNLWWNLKLNWTRLRTGFWTYTDQAELNKLGWWYLGKHNNTYTLNLNQGGCYVVFDFFFEPWRYLFIRLALHPGIWIRLSLRIGGLAKCENPLKEEN